MADLNLVSVNQTNYWDNPDNTAPLNSLSGLSSFSPTPSAYYNLVQASVTNFWDNPDNTAPLNSLSGLSSFSPTPSAYYNLVQASVTNFWDNPDNMTPLQLVNYVGVPSSGSAYTTTEGFSFGTW